MAAARKTNPATEQEHKTVETEITVERVKALQIGCRVNLHGEDKEGRHRVLECTVAGTPGAQKFLTYRASGELKRCAIKEYPNKYFTEVI